MLYAANDVGVIFALDAATGNQRWRYPTGGQISGSVTVQSNGTLYAGSSDGYLYALNASNGALRWRTQTGVAIEFTSPVVTNGVVYTGADNGKLYAINTSTGAIMWESQTGGQIFGRPAINNGAVFFGSGRLSLCGQRQHGPHPVEDAGGRLHRNARTYNGIVYITAADSVLYALRESNGSKVWSFPRSGGFGRSLASHHPRPALHRRGRRQSLRNQCVERLEGLEFRGREPAGLPDHRAVAAGSAG